MSSSARRIPVPKFPAHWTRGPAGPAAVPPLAFHTLMKEFEQGTRYQRALLPALPALPNYDLYSFHRGALLLSGDYFDCFPLPDGRVGLLVSDASGKGISGALTAMAFRAVVRNLPNERYERPAHFMKVANSLLLRVVRRGIFVSAIYAVLDPARQEITFANAGHLPLLVHHAATNKITTHGHNGPVLGVLPTKQYETKIGEITLRLADHDRVLLFTDGVNEAKAPSQLDFGTSHLHNRLLQDRDLTSKEMVKNIVEQVDIHRSGWEQSDDITIVAAQRMA
jgi:sigma-B regulation protein RsbU (phosphoserine phosphatase)